MFRPCSKSNILLHFSQASLSLVLSWLRRCWITLASDLTKPPPSATGGYLKDSYLTWNIDICLPTYLFSHLHRVTYPEYLHLDVLLLHVAVDVAAGDARLGPGLVPQDILLEEFE